MKLEGTTRALRVRILVLVSAVGLMLGAGLAIASERSQETVDPPLTDAQAAEIRTDESAAEQAYMTQIRQEQADGACQELLASGQENSVCEQIVRDLKAYAAGEFHASDLSHPGDELAE